MKIIKLARIREYAAAYPKSKTGLMRWASIVKKAEWSDINDVRSTFSHADPIKVTSGRVVTCFNIAGNVYRLITAIHYNTGKVFVLRFMPHAEYSKDKWKDEL